MKNYLNDKSVNNKMTIVYIFDNESVDLHIPISYLPETPKRTQTIRAAIKELIANNNLENKIIFMSDSDMSYEDVLKFASTIHNDTYLEHLTEKLDFVERNDVNSTVSQDTDATISKGSKNALCASVACVLNATDMCIYNNPESNKMKMFCNIRPPGHHACVNKAMGFCMLNNVAIGVQHALTKGCDMGIKRIAIVDFDCHHGNATQEIFYNDPNVLYISLHASYLESYPHTGSPYETGIDNNILNINMATGSGHHEVVTAFNEQVIPKLQKFNPNIIYISCGFDGHYLDPVGSLKYTTDTFGFMTKSLVDFADNNKECKGRIISVLEGGYSVTALKEGSTIHILELLGK